MNLAQALRPLLPGSGVIALVGAGGKTSALYQLGGELAGALMTTTTHLYDPRLEAGRDYGRLVLEPALAGPEGPWRAPAGTVRTLLAARAEPETGKLLGVHPARIGELRALWPFVVVEADGAKRRPVKAPAGHEPVVPPGTGLVLGFVGLACLGRPMDGDGVHRPELFGPVAGCAPGEPVRLEHLAALARSPRGLFQGAPAGARRVLVLNQADACALEPERILAGLLACGPVPADLVLVTCLGDPRPGARVLALE